jgi:hypothetical protein
MKKTYMVVLCGVLLFALAARVNAAVDANEVIRWTGAGDGSNWMDANNWQEDMRLPDYIIPGWVTGNPLNPGDWTLIGNKGWAVFDQGGEVTLDSTVPDARIQRFYLGGTTPTTVTLGGMLPVIYRTYFGNESTEVGTLNVPTGTGIAGIMATETFFAYDGQATINITGGTFNAVYDTSNVVVRVGHNPGSKGTINLSAGSLIVGAGALSDGSNDGYGEFYLGNKGQGRLIQTGGCVTAKKMFLGAYVGSAGYYEISGNSTVYASAYIAMQDGTSALKIIGSTPTITIGRLDVYENRHNKLQLVLDSGGVSKINIVGPVGSAYRGAALRDLIIEMSALDGITVTPGQTFDIMEAVAYLQTGTDGGRPITITSYIPGIDFTYEVINPTTSSENYILRLTAVAVAAPQCGDRLHPYPEMDFTGPDGNRDCVVDFYDFADFIDSWLERSFP